MVLPWNPVDVSSRTGSHKCNSLEVDCNNFAARGIEQSFNAQEFFTLQFSSNFWSEFYLVETQKPQRDKTFLKTKRCFPFLFGPSSSLASPVKLWYTGIFFHFDRYIVPFWQIHLAILTKIFCSLNKYIWMFSARFLIWLPPSSSASLGSPVKL